MGELDLASESLARPRQREPIFPPNRINKQAMIWNSRFVRLAAGILLLLVGILAILPNLTGYSSLDGTVNARFTILFAPIEGVVTNTPPKAGTPVAEGTELLGIRNDRISRSTEAQIEADLYTTQERLAATKEQHATLVQFQDELRIRLREHQEANVENLNQEVAIRRQQIQSVTTHEHTTRSDLTRQQTLGAGGFASKKTVETALDSAATAVSAEDNSRSKLTQLEAQLAALKRGIFVGQDRNDVPYSQQRMDEITIQLAAMRYTQEDQQALAFRLEKQLGQERTRNGILHATVVNMPFIGVIWRNSVVEGSNVIAGNELLRVLDCGDLFVDILLSEVDFDTIAPGTEAEIRLLGRSEVLKGKVSSVRGNAAVTDQVTLAATPPKSRGNSAQIRIDLPPSSLQTDYQNFCQVGRTVQVRFASHSFPLKRWLNWLWFSVT